MARRREHVRDGCADDGCAPSEQQLLVQVTTPDGVDHLVPESVLAETHTGWWVARCGAVVTSAGLGAVPGRRCALCGPEPRPEPAENRARRWLGIVGPGEGAPGR